MGSLSPNSITFRALNNRLVAAGFAPLDQADEVVSAGNGPDLVYVPSSALAAAEVRRQIADTRSSIA